MKIHINTSIEQLITALEPETIAKVLRTIDLLEKFGNQLSMPHSKKVSKVLYELRVRGKQEIRVFYCFYKREIYLLHAFIKKSQKIPQKELKIANSNYSNLTII